MSDISATACAVCHHGFTDDEWAVRHSDGLDDVHAECCVCEQESA